MAKSVRWLIPLVLVLTSCTSMLDKNFHTYFNPSSVRAGGELASLKVEAAPLEERTGTMINRIHITDDIIRAWYVGLDDAIIQSTMFAGQRKFDLTVSIRRVSAPLIVFDATATVEAFYEITDQATDTSIYAKSILSEGTASFSYSPIGIVRGNEAINRGVQNNIRAFLTDFQQSLSDRSVSPASSGPPRA